MTTSTADSPTATGRGGICCRRRWWRRGSAAVARGRLLHPRRLHARSPSRRERAGRRSTTPAFAVWLSREVGVTPVPGSSFFREGGGGRPGAVRLLQDRGRARRGGPPASVHRRGATRSAGGSGRTERAPAVSRRPRRRDRRDRRDRAGVRASSWRARGHDLLLVARDRQSPGRGRPTALAASARGRDARRSRPT